MVQPPHTQALCPPIGSSVQAWRVLLLPPSGFFRSFFFWGKHSKWTWTSLTGFLGVVLSTRRGTGWVCMMYTKLTQESWPHAQIVQVERHHIKQNKLDVPAYPSSEVYSRVQIRTNVIDWSQWVTKGSLRTPRGLGCDRPLSTLLMHWWWKICLVFLLSSFPLHRS